MKETLHLFYRIFPDVTHVAVFLQTVELLVGVVAEIEELCFDGLVSRHQLL